MSTKLYGPYLKIERADFHISELESLFRKHVKAQRRETMPKYNRAPRREKFVLGQPLPKHTPTILGDAIHNLRAALDHAFCILTEDSGNSVNERTKFPFTTKGSRTDLEGSYRGHLANGVAPSAEILNFIFNDIQPFPGGNGQDLVDLHVLDIADKHMVLLPTRQLTHVNKLSLGGGLISIEGLTIDAPANCSAFEFDLAPDGNSVNDLSYEICFGDDQPFCGEPIIPKLRHVRDRVVSTLHDLEALLV